MGPAPGLKSRERRYRDKNLCVSPQTRFALNRSSAISSRDLVGRESRGNLRRVESEQNFGSKIIARA